MAILSVLYGYSLYFSKDNGRTSGGCTTECLLNLPTRVFLLVFSRITGGCTIECLLNLPTYYRMSIESPYKGLFTGFFENNGRLYYRMSIECPYKGLLNGLFRSRLRRSRITFPSHTKCWNNTKTTLCIYANTFQNHYNGRLHILFGGSFRCIMGGCRDKQSEYKGLFTGLFFSKNHGRLYYRMFD